MLSARRYRNSLCFIFLVFLLMYNPIYAFGNQKDNGNILIFWTERGSLKAVTLMCVRGPRSPVGIVGIPVHIRISKDGANPTIAETYGRQGMQGLTAALEEMFRADIGSYLAVDQSTLDKVSNIIGPVIMENRVTTMSDVFEGTYTENEIEPQSEIRRLAAQLVTPQVLIKLPQMVRIFCSEVKTNLGFSNILNIYRAVELQGPDILRKKALTGRDYYINNCKYRDVPQETWVKALNEVTGV